MSLNYVEKNIKLIGAYRDAFGWDRANGVGLAQRVMMEDLQNFCGLNQAKFKGSESDMIKNLGRIEVLGRINFFLNYPDDDLAVLKRKIEQEIDDE